MHSHDFLPFLLYGQFYLSPCTLRDLLDPSPFSGRSFAGLWTQIESPSKMFQDEAISQKSSFFTEASLSTFLSGVY